MIKRTVHKTIRLDRGQLGDLERLAEEQNRSVSDVLRTAIDHYIKGLNAFSASQLRQARVNEYAQAAIDTIIREQHPEFREMIVAETDRRMERYHAAR